MDPKGQPSSEPYRAQIEQRRQQQRELREELAAAATRKGPGCLTSLCVFGLAVIAVTAIFAPWAFYIGNRFTPLNSWEGYGRLRSPAGADFGLFLHVGEYPAPRSRRNLSGFAALCTPPGQTLNYGVNGRIDSVWLFTEGKSTSLQLSTPGGEKPNRDLNLRGRWQNGALRLSEEGGLSRAFHPDGSLKAKGISAAGPRAGEHADVTLRHGTRFAFDEMCAG